MKLAPSRFISQATAGAGAAALLLLLLILPAPAFGGRHSLPRQQLRQKAQLLEVKSSTSSTRATAAKAKPACRKYPKPIRAGQSCRRKHEGLQCQGSKVTCTNLWDTETQSCKDITFRLPCYCQSDRTWTCAMAKCAPPDDRCL